MLEVPRGAPQRYPPSSGTCCGRRQPVPTALRVSGALGAHLIFPPQLRSVTGRKEMCTFTSL